MARRRKQYRKKHLSGLGAITDSKLFFPGLILAGAAIYLMTRKKKPTIEIPALPAQDLTLVGEGEKITGTAQRATMAPASGETVSMGSDKPKTMTDLVNQVRASEIASGPAGTEMQGGGSVSADPKEQLKLMSTPDFIELLLIKSPEFKMAVMAGAPVLGDLGAEIDRRFGADGRALMAKKQPSSAGLMGEVVLPLQQAFAQGREAEVVKAAAAYLASPDGKVSDDSFSAVAYYNVVVLELADRAAGRKSEPAPSAAMKEVLPDAPPPATGSAMLVKIPFAQAQSQFPNYVLTGFVGLRNGVPMCATGNRMRGVVERPCPTRSAITGGGSAKLPASLFPTFNFQPGKPAGQMTTAPAAPAEPPRPKTSSGMVYAGGTPPGSKYYGRAF